MKSELFQRLGQGLACLCLVALSASAAYETEDSG